MMKNRLKILGLGIVMLMIGCQNQHQPEDVNEIISEFDQSLAVQEDSFDYSILPSINLVDVTGGSAVGTVNYGFIKGIGTRLKVTAENLTELGEGQLYQVWLMHNGQYFSVGKMTKEENQYTLKYINNLNDTLFREVVVTREPDDSDAAPAEFLLQGAFPADQELRFE